MKFCSPICAVASGDSSVDPYSSIISAFGNAACARRSTSVAIGEPPCAIARMLSMLRGRASCSSAIAASIVGTAIVTVVPWRSIRSSARTALNVSSGICVPPVQMLASTPFDPAAWNSGAITSARSASLCGTVSSQ